MTDLLEKVKQKIAQLSRQIETRSGENYHDESKTVLIFEERLGVYEELLPDISSLITTIESQKEEIEKLKGIQSNFFEVMKTVIFDQEVRELTPMNKMALAVELLSQKGIFESNHKAITELAVKGLKSISNAYDRELEFCVNAADATLDEIAKLSHE